MVVFLWFLFFETHQTGVPEAKKRDSTGELDSLSGLLAGVQALEDLLFKSRPVATPNLEQVGKIHRIPAAQRLRSASAFNGRPEPSIRHPILRCLGFSNPQNSSEIYPLKLSNRDP